MNSRAERSRRRRRNNAPRRASARCDTTADEYFFVQDKNVVNIVHGTRADQEGVDSSKRQDPTGKYFAAEFNRVAAENANGGFVDYQFAKPGAPLDQPSPKLSYVKLFAPWQWTLGTGMYVDDINATVWSRVLWTAAIALAFLIAIGGFAGVVMFRLSNRLDALSTAMTSLASGESDVALPAIAGKDEVGDMARAVQVFKRNAVERARLEAEALANRSQSEIERERAAAERAKAAEEQAEVVRRLGGGLKELAGGDLMVRLGEGFSPTYAQIRDDFNEAIDRLKATVLSVVESAGAIKTGAQEISAASDDLSRRTEQQAASLEQTAATLSEVTDHGEEVGRRRRPCAAGGGRRRRGRQGERRRGASGGRRDERDRQVLAADQPDHRRDRRDRLPDQPARPQRGGRGGARRRGGPRLRRRRLRSAGAGAALGAKRPRRSRR